MIKLAQLVSKANEHYGLDLSEQQTQDIMRKLRIAGYKDTVERDDIGHVIDSIFAFTTNNTSDISLKLRHAARLTNGPALVVNAALRTCPRCKGQMRGAQLHTREMCDYCPKCKIALM